MICGSCFKFFFMSLYITYNEVGLRVHVLKCFILVSTMFFPLYVFPHTGSLSLSHFLPQAVKFASISRLLLVSKWSHKPSNSMNKYNGYASMKLIS